MRKTIIKQLNNKFSANYGSFRGYLQTIFYRLYYYLGIYRNYRDIEWAEVERLVFVCKGNICRSAFAEAVAQSLDLKTASCGLYTVDGKEANKDAVFCAARKNYDLSKHKTTSVESLLVKKGDLFIAMEPWQIKGVEERIGKASMRTLAGLWTVPKLPHIVDPYEKDAAYFETCFNHIEKSVHEIAKNLNKTRY